jgi:hypothetical protein
MQRLHSEPLKWEKQPVLGLSRVVEIDFFRSRQPGDFESVDELSV